MLDGYDSTHNVDLMRVFNRSDSALLGKSAVLDFLFNEEALEFYNNNFDLFAQSRILDMTDDEFLDYMFHLTRKRIFKLGESLNIYEFFFIKGLVFIFINVIMKVSITFIYRSTIHYFYEILHFFSIIIFIIILEKRVLY